MNEGVRTELETPPVEPDLVSPWTKNVWLFGLRTPFSLVFVGWMTLAEVMSPKFSLEIYLYSMVAVFIQSGALSLLALAVSTFVGVSVVMMHHLAIMSRESPGWKDALYLLGLYRYAVYLVAVVAFVGRILGI